MASGTVFYVNLEPLGLLYKDVLLGNENIRLFHSQAITNLSLVNRYWPLFNTSDGKPYVPEIDTASMSEFDNKLLDLQIFIKDMFLDIRDLWRVKSNPTTTSRDEYRAAMNTMYVMQSVGLGYLLERYKGETLPKPFTSRNILQFAMVLKDTGYKTYGAASDHMILLAQYMINNANKIEEILSFDYAKYHVTVNKLYAVWLTIQRIINEADSTFEPKFLEFKIKTESGIPTVSAKANINAGRIILRATTGELFSSPLVNGEATFKINEYSPPGTIMVVLETITLHDSKVYTYEYVPGLEINVTDTYVAPDVLTVDELLSTKSNNVTTSLYDSITTPFINIWETGSDEEAEFIKFWNDLNITDYEPIHEPMAPLIDETTGQASITVEQLENILKNG